MIQEVDFFEVQVNPFQFAGLIPAGSDHALKRLIEAVIAQAAKDARKELRDSGARMWLTSKDCAEMCEFIGLDHNRVRAWVGAGCPKWGRRGLDAWNRDRKRTEKRTEIRFMRLASSTGRKPISITKKNGG